MPWLLKSSQYQLDRRLGRPRFDLNTMVVKRKNLITALAGN
jgi:hypothetical protein